MSTASYNCPCCGGPLKFSGESGKLECTACGNHYEPEALEMMTPDESGDEITFANDAKRFDTGEAGMRAYLSKNCGAELMADETTTAAECPYCGSPTILPDRIEDGVKPEKVIPFVVSKEQAQNYFKGKKLLPNVFLNSRNRISEMRRCTFLTGFSAATRAPTWCTTRKRSARSKRASGKLPARSTTLCAAKAACALKTFRWTAASRWTTSSPNRLNPTI